MNISFSIIETVLAIRRYSSMSRAAKELYISEPALSKQIRRMENELGYPLISRTSAGCTLTQAGNILADRGAELLRQRDLMIHEMDRAGKASTQKHLKFGIANCYCETLLNRFMPACMSLHPQIGLELIINKTDTLEQMCISKDVDVILTQKEACCPRLETVPLLKEETVVYLPKSYCDDPALAPYIEKGCVPLKVLEPYPYADSVGHERYIQYTKQFLDEAGFHPNTVFQSENWPAVLSAIQNRMCFSIMPDLFECTDSVIRLHIDSSIPAVRTLALAYLPQDDMPEELSEFIDCVTCCLSEADAE